MTMQPIRARSLKFVVMLRANKPSRTVCDPSQTLHKAEDFFAKYRIDSETTEELRQ